MRHFALPIILGALIAAVSMQQVIADDVENCWCGTEVSLVGETAYDVIAAPNVDDTKCTKPLSDEEHSARRRVLGTGYCLGEPKHLCCDKCRESFLCSLSLCEPYASSQLTCA